MFLAIDAKKQDRKPNHGKGKVLTRREAGKIPELKCQNKSRVMSKHRYQFVITEYYKSKVIV